jgi:hypothetical protein
MDQKKFLGSGGFANVYMVTRKSDGVKCALKKSLRPISGMKNNEV